ncbi:NADH:ubiquinone reductase (Na(+)-transporting) subunit F [Desulfatitalea tepidiphila]|uniref:NADH:ubiquinone reductase (Na(+)-transporting) subunit F n=1 Tax=Desulfatitalea tepidiphila TaxID=1185843 RepID=UPI0006B4546A|nr:NADH:ubiquinone reductase (Na(+)-transporting) subunit F [Desulfatitalea tepidiphila]
MSGIYLISLAVFLGVILLLVGLLLVVESQLTVKGDRRIVINGDESKSVTTPGGKTLLSALIENKIYLPSACGGKGTCGTCKCKVLEGGGDILPTELSLVSRKERIEHVRLACQVKVKQDMSIQIPDEIFNIQKYTATVVSNDNVATFIKELVLKLDEGQTIQFKAGAYMQIDIPEYEAEFKDFSVAEKYKAAWKQYNLLTLKAKSDEPANRAYSLANPPVETDLLKFTIRIATPPPGKEDLPPGVGSSYVFNLKPGDRVTISGPYGDFFAKQTEREMCFIGGGAGMAPLRSHIRQLLLGVESKRRITFWYGARSRQEMFYDEEFKELEARFSNFSYHVALSDPQPEDKWHGPTGFIHQVALKQYLGDHPDPTEIEYYLCGPPPMVAAVEKMLYDLGVENDMIAYDKFG